MLEVTNSMTYDDIVKLLSNPDKFAEGLVELDSYNKTVTTELDTLKTKASENEQRIKDLQDTNFKLSMRITGKEEPDEPDPPTPEEVEEGLMNKIREDLKNGNNH